MNKIIKEINKYSGFIKVSIQEVIAYKFRIIIWSLSSVTILLINYFIWKSVFESKGGNIYGIELNQYISYIGIGMLVAMLTDCYQDNEITKDAKKGDIAINLIKPLDYKKIILARHAGSILGKIIEIIPVVIAIVFLGGVISISFTDFLFFLISLILTSMLVFNFIYLVSLLSFWLINVWGLYLLRENLRILFSGEAVALVVLLKIGTKGIDNNPFPFISNEVIESFFKLIAYISYALPFQAMYYTPAAIYTGLIVGNEITIHILIQIFWLILFYFLINYLWNKALKKMSIHGG